MVADGLPLQLPGQVSVRARHILAPNAAPVVANIPARDHLAVVTVGGFTRVEDAGLRLGQALLQSPEALARFGVATPQDAGRVAAELAIATLTAAGGAAPARVDA